MGHASGLGAPSCDRAASCGGREVSYAAGLVAQLDESATRRLRPWKIKKLKKCFAMFDKDKNALCGIGLGLQSIDREEGKSGMIEMLSAAYDGCVASVEALPISAAEADDVLTHIELHLYGTKGSNSDKRESKELQRHHVNRLCWGPTLMWRFALSIPLRLAT